MKTKLIIKLCIFVMALSVHSSVWAAQKGSSWWSAGVKYHSERSMITEAPFDEGDLSYCLAYEYHEDTGCWQLALGFTPDAEGAMGVDYVITPEMNLIFSDRSLKLGLGILSDYVSSEMSDDWSDMYWQFLAGFDLSLGGFNLDLMSYYVFKDWDEVGDFEMDDLEYGLWANFSF